MLGRCSDSDVIFKFENSSCACARSLFSHASPLFKEIFECDEADRPFKRYSGIFIKKCSLTKQLTLSLDASFDVFNFIYKFICKEKIEDSEFLLPQVFLLAKNLQCNEVWPFVLKELIKSVSLQNIGEICALVFLDSKMVRTEIDDETSEEAALADATCNFLVANADALACSQTGQLSARIYVDVLCDENNQEQQNECNGLKLNLSDWDLTERILQVCGRRIRDMEPLDDNTRSRKLTNQVHATAKDTVTDEIRLTISEAQLRGYAKPAVSLPISLCSTTTGISSCPEEDECEREEDDSVLNDLRASVLSSDSSNSLPPATCPDVETCLLARTHLEGGSISIYLGKLEGRLVSLSVKRKTVIGPSSTSSLTNSIILTPSASCRVVTKSPDRLHTSSPHKLHSLAMDGELNLQFGEDYGKKFPVSKLSSTRFLKTLLSVPRAAAGAVCLTGEVSEDENSLVLLAGGYTQDGCLKTVELLKISTEKFEKSGYRLSTSSSLGYGTASECTSPTGEVMGEEFIPLPGPSMHCARGRLALALADKPMSMVFACGGSDGSRDLASVECLAIDSLMSGMPPHFLSVTTSNRKALDSAASVTASPENFGDGWQFVANLKQARSCCTAAVLDKSKVVVLGGQFAGRPLSTVETYEMGRNEWLSLPPMIEARTQLCSASVSTRGLIFAVGGICEVVGGQEITASCISSLLASTSDTLPESNFHNLPATAEAFDDRTSQWIRLPEFDALGPLIGATLAPLDCSDRLLLIGGSDGHSALAQTQIFDLRTWTWSCGPTLQLGRSNPSAVQLSPFSLAILGGYNSTMGGFLNSVEIIASQTLPTISPYYSQDIFTSNESDPIFDAFL